MKKWLGCEDYTEKEACQDTFEGRTCNIVFSQACSSSVFRWEEGEIIIETGACQDIRRTGKIVF